MKTFPRKHGPTVSVRGVADGCALLLVAYPAPELVLLLSDVLIDRAYLGSSCAMRTSTNAGGDDLEPSPRSLPSVAAIFSMFFMHERALLTLTLSFVYVRCETLRGRRLPVAECRNYVLDTHWFVDGLQVKAWDG